MLPVLEERRRKDSMCICDSHKMPIEARIASLRCTMRYFVYCRKSSEAEDRQVASIESQLSTLKRTFGQNTSAEIVEIYEEAFSAKAPGRPRFGEMISRLEAGVADGIIAWAPDRLAWNSIDGGHIIYMLDCCTIKDSKFCTCTLENNSQSK